MPLWFRLPFFFDALLALSFGLKYICPIDIGCVSDPFVKIFFEPLFFVEKREWFIFTPAKEVVFLLLIWFVVGFLLGGIIEFFRKIV